MDGYLSYPKRICQILGPNGSLRPIADPTDLADPAGLTDPTDLEDPTSDTR